MLRVAGMRGDVLATGDSGIRPQPQRCGDERNPGDPVHHNVYRLQLQNLLKITFD